MSKGELCYLLFVGDMLLQSDITIIIVDAVIRNEQQRGIAGQPGRQHDGGHGRCDNRGPDHLTFLLDDERVLGMP